MCRAARRLREDKLGQSANEEEETMEAFSDEHEELRSTVRQLFADQSDEQAVRDQMATDRGWDAELWQQLAEQVGLAGLIIPEEHGGAGFGYVELCVVAEEMGRALVCAPYLSTAVFATNALLLCATAAAQKALLPGIASGETIATVAWSDDNGRWDTPRWRLEPVESSPPDAALRSGSVRPGSPP